MSFATNAPGWALGYLRGRADAFRRGRLTLASVRGAVRKAQALGANYADIANVLATYGLTWDVEHEVLRQS
jgi:hypothetical protein